MPKKRIPLKARLKGPSPEVGRRNLLVGVLLAVAAILVVAVIAVGINRGEKPAAAPASGRPDAGNARDAAYTRQLYQLQADKSARQVTIGTARGQIVMDVYPDLMPTTVKNFDKLVQSGFYNGLTFHRVEAWVIQGGDPKGDGTGGSGTTIPLETNPQLKNVRGAVAMARATDPNSASSQFYILKSDRSDLDGQYAVFGMVVQGMDVADQIQQGDKMLTVKE